MIVKYYSIVGLLCNLMFGSKKLDGYVISLWRI